MKSFYGFFIILAFIANSCKTNSSATIPETNIRKVVNSPGVVLVDVRIPEQYAEGTAKNAINIPLAELSEKTGSLEGKKVVVFCNKGIQADQALEILKKGGIEAYDGTTWKNVKAIQDEKVSGK
ncbi:rhodanese-like domain-containing protein [Chryseobacterium sp. CCH4-E10]|uniref:rhodanese-like domain-containing protein n=1 Tax=Chryseobacterium sp. CCH4-E10 TaxID=1768758 RepID=UPI00082A8D5E|nr:rhodanese-like domain-containing protein [Chryseobacterium sp. CCH4-E10]